MEFILSRAEFFALAAMTRADEIIGLSAADLVPASPAARQALYTQGEARLQQRDLLRTNATGEAVLEENLLRMLRVVTTPDSALVVVKTTPGIGAQLFLFYGREGQYVEQTLPDDNTHRLAEVGPASDVRERLGAIFPVPQTGAGSSGFQADTQAIVAAYNLVRSGDPDQARIAIGVNGNADERAHWLDAIAKLTFSGTIAFIQVIESETNEARELAVFASPSSAWLSWNMGDGNASVGQIDERTFAQVVDAALRAVANSA